MLLELLIFSKGISVSPTEATSKVKGALFPPVSARPYQFSPWRSLWNIFDVIKRGWSRCIWGGGKIDEEIKLILLVV